MPAVGTFLCSTDPCFDVLSFNTVTMRMAALVECGMYNPDQFVYDDPTPLRDSTHPKDSSVPLLALDGAFNSSRRTRKVQAYTIALDLGDTFPEACSPLAFIFKAKANTSRALDGFFGYNTTE